jgi:Gpi16 subunit, GPI transamidase component
MVSACMQDKRWLAGLACQDMHVLHTTASVVTVAQPDFSMPYIVCALSSSVLAIFSGVLFTRLVERPQQSALRQLKSGNSLKAKLRPVIIIVACVILVPYMDPEWRDWVVAHLESAGIDPAAIGLA